MTFVVSDKLCVFSGSLYNRVRRVTCMLGAQQSHITLSQHIHPFSVCPFLYINTRFAVKWIQYFSQFDRFYHFMWHTLKPWDNQGLSYLIRCFGGTISDHTKSLEKYTKTEWLNSEISPTSPGEIVCRNSSCFASIYRKDESPLLYCVWSRQEKELAPKQNIMFVPLFQRTL